MGDWDRVQAVKRAPDVAQPSVVDTMGSAQAAPLRDVLLVATGPAVLLAEHLQAIPGIEGAFLYGSFAARMRGVEGPASHDIDACSKVEESVSRPVNPTILTASEVRERSGFLDDLRAKPVVPILGGLPWQ